ncbi:MULTISPECIES: dimethylarginine dimethylaminohydrolase family protein [Sporosarcina]|uniref:N-dimethylarginine dimethylaminohydrolase n=1 Tax=Sporosarcina newyorkensis 2681 TaxID=1027292 RepID=F9DUR4_9BACL|nr:arginine deiminase family protein [Sporosarcina newyorkensis]EGQ24102.1 N-dimethylarginine dimethylaminohydrolase [Sporosarcina newyorkensis 2681]
MGGTQTLVAHAQKTSTIKCITEYDTLRRVILCPPKFMAIEEAINEVQKQYEDENIDKQRAMKQHAQFEELLKEHDVEVITLPASSEFPEQVFTRDIGFTIGDEVFIADLAADIRKGEEAPLKEWLSEEDVPYQSATERMEGGDIIVDRGTVYVGISSRTSKEAINQLEKKLPDYKIKRVPFDGRYLHLDCVFNILSPEKALIFPSAFDRETLKELAASYQLIEVSADEQFSLGTNVLSIGKGHVFSLPQNHQVNMALRANGFHVIEVDFSEIIKSGGSFRCCSMPIERG